MRKGLALHLVFLEFMRLIFVFDDIDRVFLDTRIYELLLDNG